MNLITVLQTYGSYFIGMLYFGWLVVLTIWTITLGQTLSGVSVNRTASTEQVKVIYSNQSRLDAMERLGTERLQKILENNKDVLDFDESLHIDYKGSIKK